MDDLRVTEDLVIPARELEWRFDPAGGPGGQHANKSSTRVELRYDAARSSVLTGDRRARVLAHPAVTDGAIVVRVSESRSQWRNRQLARRRLAETLVEAMRPPPPRRKRTRPTKAAKQRRLAAKKARAEIKQLRKRPERE